jgi:hypothetical protein
MKAVPLSMVLSVALRKSGYPIETSEQNNQ